MSFAFSGSMGSGGGYDPGMTLRDYFAIYAVLSAASYHGGFHSVNARTALAND
jgi:hypothetical protein